MKEVRAAVSIRGRVQGVSFRYYTQRVAEDLGLRGWVRNRSNGDVEALFEGEESSVQQMVDWCRSGPDAARVEDVSVDWQSPSGEFRGFRVLR